MTSDPSRLNGELIAENCDLRARLARAEHDRDDLRFALIEIATTAHSTHNAEPDLFGVEQCHRWGCKVAARAIPDPKAWQEKWTGPKAGKP